MPKALKISGFTITEIEYSNDSPCIRDEEYKLRTFDTHALCKTEAWGYKKFRLGFVCWDTFRDEDNDYNILGTYIYRMLKDRRGDILDDIIPGPVYLINEDRDGIIDFTKEDLNYILHRSSLDTHENNEKIKFMMKVFMSILIKFPDLM